MAGGLTRAASAIHVCRHLADSARTNLTVFVLELQLPGDPVEDWNGSGSAGQPLARPAPAPTTMASKDSVFGMARSWIVRRARAAQYRRTAAMHRYATTFELAEFNLKFRAGPAALGNRLNRRHKRCN
jgi:hypothetical protein